MSVVSVGFRVDLGLRGGSRVLTTLIISLLKTSFEGFGGLYVQKCLGYRHPDPPSKWLHGLGRAAPRKPSSTPDWPVKEVAEAPSQATSLNPKP